MAPEPILLTPGPLTTQLRTRQAMLRDWGSRDPGFIALTAELRQRLLDVAKGQEDFERLLAAVEEVRASA